MLFEARPRHVCVVGGTGIYPFADEFSSQMHVSRETFFFMLSIGELVGALAVFTGEWQ